MGFVVVTYTVPDKALRLVNEEVYEDINKLTRSNKVHFEEQQTLGIQSRLIVVGATRALSRPPNIGFPKEGTRSVACQDSNPGLLVPSRALCRYATRPNECDPTATMFVVDPGMAMVPPHPAFAEHHPGLPVRTNLTEACKLNPAGGQHAQPRLGPAKCTYNWLPAASRSPVASKLNPAGGQHAQPRLGPAKCTYNWLPGAAYNKVKDACQPHIT
ncbi:hypothetical protein Bbelb_204850 [Branchiostoma belcheri]|nr:hypothetical protein Bbelb_204850 [Branchiostoma belcheri]